MPPLSLLLSLPLLHVPHDNAHGVASALLPNGQIETVIATQRECRVLRTRDEGLSWQPVAGAGIELGRPDVVIWDPHPATPRFLIGTDAGIWSYEPLTDVVQPFNAGLPIGEGERWACQMSVPTAGNSAPLFMVNKLGQVWKLNRDTQSWDMLLDSGLADERGQIAVVPNFDKTAAPGPNRMVVASFQGVLYYSQTGGRAWQVHPQFPTPGPNWDDPRITAITFSHDFASSGTMALATSQADTSSFSGDEGHIWHSADFGASFQMVHQVTSSVRSMESTPIGPSGQSWLLVSVYEHPHFVSLANSVGVLRSADGGATWSDYGTAQDFAMESDSAETVKHGRALIHDFAVSPTFASDGQIVFGRSEGLYYTNNEGLHWMRRSFRPTSQVRGLDSYYNAAGELIAVAGSYGSGTWMQNVNTNEVTLLPNGASSYVDEIDCSPRMADDGMMLVGGARGLSFWFDPVLGAVNPHQSYGWKNIPIERQVGYVRSFAYSPQFDGRGTPGSDQVFFFSTSSQGTSNYVTDDGGLSFTKLDETTSGGVAPYMRHIKIAPTFVESDLTGAADVYAARSKWLFKYNAGKWELIHTFPSWVTGIAIPEDYDRDSNTPGLPRIFVSTEKAPFFYEFIDEPGNPVLNEYAAGLGDGTVVGIACPSNFAATQTVYLATFTSGIRKIDLSQPAPAWTEVGTNFPNLWLTTFSLAPDFANDPTIIAGAQSGLVIGQDLPGMSWQVHDQPLVRDNEAAEFNYYSPNHPDNPESLRTWRWDLMNIQSTAADTDLEFIDVSVHHTDVDGSYVTANEYAEGVVLHTVRGPDCGSVNLHVENYWTGQLLQTLTVDLNSTKWANRDILVEFPMQPVRIFVTAQLDPGETFYFDGMTFGE